MTTFAFPATLDEAATMPWGRLDDAAPNHKKHRDLRQAAGSLRGAAAFGFDFAGGCYCNRELTDGFISDGDLPMVMLGLSVSLARTLAGLLVDAGRWKRVEGGYEIHDFLDYNKSRAEVLAEREAAKERQRVRRKSQPDFGGSHSVTSQEVRRKSQRDFTGSSADVRGPRPGPTRPIPELDQKTPQNQKPSDGASPASGSGRQAWDGYSTAYQHRYGVQPVRNAKVNSQLVAFVRRIPAAEAHDVAAWYVGNNAALYVRAGHPVDLLLRDAEKLRTEWATGQRITEAGARAGDQRQERGGIAERLLRKAASQEVPHAES